jgi:hypothetical protein
MIVGKEQDLLQAEYNRIPHDEQKLMNTREALKQTSASLHARMQAIYLTSSPKSSQLWEEYAALLQFEADCCEKIDSLVVRLNKSRAIIDSLIRLE